MDDESNVPKLISVKPLKPEFTGLENISITSDKFTLGRSIGLCVVIKHLPISRLHCIFSKSENNEWTIQDFSSFGIRVNEKKLEKGTPTKLSNGDVIILDPTADLIYKFSHPISDDYETPQKRFKLDTDDNILNNVKMKFEESQNYEIKHIEKKIQNAKAMQTTSIILKQQLQADMNRKIKILESDFAAQIENLKGEKNEIERQKVLLIEERNEQLAEVKNEMETKITELMDQIQKHNESESELLKENNQLKDKLDKEREEFLAELSRESSSKKDMLDKLEAKIKEQEEIQQREKQELKEMLQKETEQLRLAKEIELQAIAEEKRQRELELEQELTNIKQKLQEKVELTEQQRLETERQLNEKMEQLQKLSDEEKIKVEHLEKERENIQNQLLEAQKNAEASLAELKHRETELAALATARIQAQAEQSNQVTTLQVQLEKMKTALESLESEKRSLLSMFEDSSGEGTSKQGVLNEVGELMESELQCSICAELFIEATTLNCSHTFCKYCITKWKEKKKDCPICRAPISSENRSLVIDSFIEKMVNQNLTEEMKLKRQEILKNRAEEVAVMMNPRSARTNCPSRRRRTTQRMSTGGRGGGTTRGRGAGAATATPIQIPHSVDLTMVPIPMSPAERPPVLAPPVLLVRAGPARPAGSAGPARPAGPARQAGPARPALLPRSYPPPSLPPPPPMIYLCPEIIDLTLVPFGTGPSSAPAATGNIEVIRVEPVLVDGVVDVDASPASRAATTAATGAATGAARAATGRPAAPSTSRAHAATD